MKTEWRDGDRSRSVELQSLGNGRYRVCVDESRFVLTAEALEEGRMRLVSGEGVVVAEVTAVGERRFVRLGAQDFVLDREASGRRRVRTGSQGGLEAPMPGAVTRVLVAPGDSVTRGQPLVAVEAMKMEHVVRAPRDGRIRTVCVQAGESVAGGTALIEMDPQEP